jgi:hypothetical protein
MTRKDEWHQKREKHEPRGSGWASAESPAEKDLSPPKASPVFWRFSPLFFFRDLYGSRQVSRFPDRHNDLT